MLPETEIEHQTGTGQPQGEGVPKPDQPTCTGEAKQIGCRQGDQEIGDEGIIGHALHIRDASQGIRIGTLQAIAKLIDHKGNHQLGHQTRYLRIVGKPGAQKVSAGQQRDGKQNGHHPNQLHTGLGGTTNAHHIPLAFILTDLNGHGCRQSIIDHVPQLTDREHHLMSGQGDNAHPSDQNGGQTE